MRSSPLFDRHAKLALIMACLVLVVGGVGFRAAARLLDVYLMKEPVELRWHFDNIPTSLGDWEMVEEGPKLSAEMVEELGTDLYLDRRYRREGDETWLMVHLAYYTGMIDAVPHVPDRCFVAGGFNPRSVATNLPISLTRRRWKTQPDGSETVTFRDAITRAAVTVSMPEGDFRLRTTEFSLDDAPNSRIYAGYFFIANNRIAATPEEVKRVAFRKSEKHAYYCKVQFSTVGSTDLTEGAFVAEVAELTEALLPELMRCLPDWAEVLASATHEAGAASGGASGAAGDGVGPAPENDLDS